MFKKIASILLAAIMVGSTAVVAASAAEADNAVAAADDSAVAAADDSAVAAADDSAVAAGDDSTVGAGNKVYFELQDSYPLSLSPRRFRSHYLGFQEG